MTLTSTANGSSRNRRGQAGQGLLEFAMISPLVLLMLFLLIDFGRLLYAYTAISSAARDGERIISLKSNQNSDCYALQTMEQVGQAFPLRVDPNSLVGNTDPNNSTGTLQPTTPPSGVGYIYMWPAVATQSPQDVSPNCSGNARTGSGTARQVAVEIQYHFVPLTPLPAGIGANIVVKTISVGQTEY